METKAQYFDCLCRTCMNKVEASSRADPTNPQKQWLSISDIIAECGALRIAGLLSDAVPQIVVQPSDELPQKICSECLQRLLSVYWFQQMCVQSDKEMHELLSKEQITLKTPMLGEEIKDETETNDADSQPLKDLLCSSTLKKLQLPSVQESLPEVTVPTIEPDVAQSSADHLQDNTQLLGQCIDAQGEFEEFIKNEPIEDDNPNSEYSDGDTMHSTISVIKYELIEPEDQQVNDASLAEQPLRFDSKSHMACHKTSHKRIKLHKCDICGKEFKIRSSLIKHKLIHSGGKPHKCEVCENRFAWHYQLLYHMRLHPGEKPLNCKQSTEEQQQQKLSNKKIGQPSTDIPAEQRTTYADRPYECPYCLRRFNSKANVSRHKAVHEWRPHQCDICVNKFQIKHDLIKHKRIHSKEKFLKCDLCERRFTQSQHLQAHINTHTGEKPYKCKYCECGFAASSTLRCHLRCHLGKNIYRCKFCPLACPSSAELRLHLTSHKNEDTEVRERNLKALEEEEAKLMLKFSKEKSKEESTEEQQQQQLSNKEIKQPSTEHLTKHHLIHNEDKPYESPHCPLRFNSKTHMASHKTSHEEGKRHECDICGKGYKTRSSFILHKLIHREEKPHKCEVCEKRFTHMQSLETHIRTHTGEKPYKCKYCELGFTAHSLLSNHLRCHLGKNIYRCKLCPLAFPSSAEVRLHLTSHKNEDPETREQNLKALQEEEDKLVLKFSKEKSKGQATDEPQQQKLSNKEIEQQSTDSKGNASRRKTSHEEAAKRHECDFCGKKFRMKSDLIVHRRIHTKEKPYKCDLCEKRFAQTQHLKAHIYTHTREDKPFKCPHCPKRFSTKSVMATHKAIHEGIKPHKCSICGKQFLHKGDLKRHKRIHSKEKPHKCDLCERRFTQSQHLIVHIRSHTGDKPYKCKYCERGYVSSTLLNYHLRSHLGKNIYRCKFCPLAFPSSAEMRSHLITHKNEDQEVRERNLKALQEEEAKLKLNILNEKSKEESTEEQQQQKLSNKKMEQPSTELEELEEFIKNEPIEDDKSNRK